MFSCSRLRLKISRISVLPPEMAAVPELVPAAPDSESTRGLSRMQRAMVLDAEARVLSRTHNSVEYCPRWRMRRPRGRQLRMPVPHCPRRCRPRPEPPAGPVAPVATSVQCRFPEPEPETPRNPSHLLRPGVNLVPVLTASDMPGNVRVSNLAGRSTTSFPIRNHWRSRTRRRPRTRAASRAGRQSRASSQG